MVSKAILFLPRERRRLAGARFTQGAAGRCGLGLFPIANRPVVLHAVDALAAAGIRELMVVCSPDEAPELRALTADLAPAGVELTLLAHGDSDELGASLVAAEAFLDGAPFVIHLGDSLTREPLAAKLQNGALGPNDALALVQQDDGAAGSSLVALRADPLVGRDPAGVYVVGSGLIGAVRSAPDVPGLEEALLAAIAELALRGGRVETVPVASWWRYRGRPGGLLEANRFLLEGLPAQVTETELVDTIIQGHVAIDASARLESTVVRGPAVIGPGAHLVNAYVGPYSSIGPDVLVEGAEIEHSIILPGASITHLGGRLEASIVGAQARVFRDFRLPRALRLNVGEGAEVSLA
jgi:glucose-1-phosphate thymidylyltransferase